MPQSYMIDKLTADPLKAGAFLLLALAAAINLAALGFEHIGGFEPCELCFLERKAWYAGVPAALLALLAAWLQRPVIGKLILAVMALFFLANMVLAFWHAGIEWKWWTGPSSCTGTGLAPLGGAGGLLEQLAKTRIIPCDEAQFRLFGLSFAGYNVFMSLLAALFALYGVFAQKR